MSDAGCNTCHGSRCRGVVQPHPDIALEAVLRAALEAHGADPHLRQLLLADLITIYAGRLDRLADGGAARGYVTEAASDHARAAMHRAYADSVRRRIENLARGEG